MKLSSLIAQLLLCLGLVATASAANTEPTFALLDTFGISFSHTAETNLRGDFGTVLINRYDMEAGGRTTTRVNGTFTHGVALVRTELDVSGPNRIPETLQEVSARLGWQKQI